MRLRITLKGEHTVVPISYQSSLQGLIYKTLSYAGLGDFYHDEGYTMQDKIFKCFVFSNIFGKYTLDNGKLIFDEQFYFYVGSQDDLFINQVFEVLRTKDQVVLNNQIVEIEELKLFNINEFEGSKILTIRALSPILLYTTDGEHSDYYDLENYKSTHLILQNIRNKSKAYGFPIEEPIFEIIDIIYEKRRMVTYKGCVYPSYQGELKVRINYETLSFIYNCGLGSKNSAGFGMIEIVRGKKK